MSFGAALYYAVSLLTLVFLPIGCSGWEVWHFGQSFPEAASRWFTFWAVGISLALTGVRQTLQPRYTAQNILHLVGDEAVFVVRELGYANFAFATLGIMSLVQTSWRAPAELGGGMFYFLAGASQFFQRHRNRREDISMFSDVYAGAVLLGLFSATR